MACLDFFLIFAEKFSPETCRTVRWGFGHAPSLPYADYYASYEEYEEFTTVPIKQVDSMNQIGLSDLLTSSVIKQITSAQTESLKNSSNLITENQNIEDMTSSIVVYPTSSTVMSNPVLSVMSLSADSSDSDVRGIADSIVSSNVVNVGVSATENPHGFEWFTGGLGKFFDYVFQVFL